MDRRRFMAWSTLASLSHVLGDRALWAAAAASGPSSPAEPGQPSSLFLRDNFAPVADETTCHDLKIVGALPRELRGMYVRNGPNPMFPPRGNYHWFDGDGMLHGVSIEDGKASYRNRYIQTKGLAAETKAGQAIYGGLLDPPTAQDLLRGPYDAFKNAGNTALVWHHQDLLALWEAGPPHRIQVPSLDTLGLEDFAGKLRQPFTAHPKIDPVSGEMRYFGYGILGRQIGYGVVDPTGNIVHQTFFSGNYPSMMHDFAVTENYAIFYELPCVLRFEPGSPLFGYRPDLGARLGILPARGKAEDVRWFDIDPCFVFHTLNAYEVGDTIEVLACRAAEFPPILSAKGTSADAEWTAEWSGYPQLCRWTIDLASGTCRQNIVDDAYSEFPRVNDSLAGRKTRFGYSMSIDFSRHYKYDFVENDRQTHEHGNRRFAGEALFVARENARAEDDGWLLSFVFDADREKSELVVLDAQDFTSAPVARVLLPVRVPFGFHGAWIPQDEMAAAT